MRDCKYPPHFLMHRACLVAVVLSWAGTALGQQLPDDPVANLQWLLKAPARDLSERDRNVRKQVERIHDLTDLRRALLLSEWRDEDLDKPLAAVDRSNRMTLAKRFEQAMRSALRNGNTRSRLSAMNMLVEMNPSAQGVLAGRGVGRNLALDLAGLIQQGQPSVCEAAAESLGQIHPDPAVALPALGSLLGTSEVSRRRAASKGLVYLMRGTLQIDGDSLRAVGVEAARRNAVAIGSAVIPVAARGFIDPDPQVRILCLEAFGEAAAVLNKLVFDPRLHSLEEGRDDGRNQIRQEWLELMPLMMALKNQSPALIQALNDSDERVQILARRVLEDMALGKQRFGHRAASVGFVLPAGSWPGEEQLQASARKIRPSMPDDPLAEGLHATLPALTAGVSDPDVHARLRAIDALEALGQAAAPAAPALVRALTDPDRFVRWAAARTLGKMGPAEAGQAVPALVKLLDDPEVDVRMAAAGALEHYGPAAKMAVPALIRLIKVSDPGTRAAAVRALKGIGPDAEAAIPALWDALADPDSRVRQTVVEVLGKLDTARRNGNDVAGPPPEEGHPERDGEGGPSPNRQQLTLPR